MQKQVIIFLFLSLICIVNGQYKSDNYKNSNYKKSSSCKRFANKVYQLTVTFPQSKSLYAELRLLPDGSFDEIFSIANGDSAAEVGANFSLSGRIGYYKCLNGDDMRLTAVGFLYKTPDVPFLPINGAVVIHDYYFRFSNNDKSICR